MRQPQSPPPYRTVKAHHPFLATSSPAQWQPSSQFLELKNTKRPPCCCLFTCYSSAFQLPPMSRKYLSSNSISPSRLALFRFLAFLHLFVVGFVMVWLGYPSPGLETTWSLPPRFNPNNPHNDTKSVAASDDFADDDWFLLGNMPPAYLTNWGFISTLGE